MLLNVTDCTIGKTDIWNDFCGQKLKSGFEAFYDILGVYNTEKQNKQTTGQT
jgi:hypothetical protein